MNPHALQRIGVVGTGAMGQGIAQIMAQAGLNVLLFDAREGAASAAPTTGATAALNSAEKSDGASGWMAGDGSSIWMNVAPSAASPSISARRIGTKASAASLRCG